MSAIYATTSVNQLSMGSIACWCWFDSEAKSFRSEQALVGVDIKELLRVLFNFQLEKVSERSIFAKKIRPFN